MAHRNSPNFLKVVMSINQTVVALKRKDSHAEKEN